MFCFIYKWFISRSMDTGKPVPPIILRHLGHCKSCKGFAGMGQALNERLVRDAAGILEDSPHRLAEKIISALPLQPDEPETPGGFSHSIKPRRRSFRLVLSTVAASLVIVAGVWWFVGDGRPPGPTPPPVTPSLEIPAIETSFLELGASVESPLTTELTSLKQAVASTKDFFESGLDFGIGDMSTKIKL
ncbi:MAG: hypothetical protein GY940_28195 [bacterium]|nr:hypothetical protein [bacterium]